MLNEVTLKRFLAYSSLLSLSFAIAACGSDESEEKGAVGDTCALESSECDSGLSCDPLVSGDGYVCATPVTLKGVVTDALTGDTLASSRVVVLSAEGAPVGDVVYTGEDGAYSVAVSAPRNPDGSLAQDAKWTLTVSAQGYEVFPAGPRPAVPIAATQATAGEDEGSRVIDA